MLPNPFQKQLPEFKDTDPLKNREIVRELLGPEGVHKYRKILGDNSYNQNKRQKDVSREELLAIAAEALSKIDSLSRDIFKPIFERLIEKGYTSQIKSLKEINFLETKDNKLGLTAIDNKFYEVPTTEAITNHFLFIPNIKQKIDQGFTRLLIVPFGFSLDTLRGKTVKLIKKHKKANKLFAEDGSSLELDEKKPLWALGQYNNADKSGDLVYYPEQFDKENHGGKTKRDLLSSVASFPGYHILLIQEDQTIQRGGEGAIKEGRNQIGTGKSPNDYLELFKTDESYSKELGLTPEDWLTLFATNLNQKNKVINDWESDKDSINYLVGSYFPDFDSVPGAYWSRGYEQARLGGREPLNVDERYGVAGGVG